MSLELPGYELLVVRVLCEACQGAGFMPIGRFDEWATSHILPGADLALVVGSDGAKQWVQIRTERVLRH